jgi:hypothetical protein
MMVRTWTAGFLGFLIITFVFAPTAAESAAALGKGAPARGSTAPPAVKSTTLGTAPAALWAPRGGPSTPALRGSPAVPHVVHVRPKSLSERTAMAPERTGGGFSTGTHGLTRVALPTHAFRGSRHHHRGFGFGLPLTAIVGEDFYGTYYDPSDLVIPVEGPTELPPPGLVPGPERFNPTIAQQRRCTAQVVIVPKERGGEQSITIVRC